MRSSRAKWIVFVIKFDFLLSVLGSRHCACQNLTLPAGPQSLHRHTVHQACPYTYSHSWFNSQRRPVSPPLTIWVRYLSKNSPQVARLESQDGCPLQSGSSLNRTFVLKPLAQICQVRSRGHEVMRYSRMRSGIIMACY